MKKKILSENKTLALFDEVLKHPLFVLELNEYEKSKILEIAFNEQKQIQIQAFAYLRDPLETSLLNETEVFRLYLIANTDLIDNLEDVPKENRLYYFLTEISENALSLKVLFHNLGFNWDLDNGQIRPIENPQPLKNIKIEIENNTIKNVFEGLKSFFKEDEHNKLERVVNGLSFEGQITFIGNKNQLPELLKRLEYNQLIKNPLDKTDLAKWIIQNFNTTKGPYVFDTLNKWLTSTEFKIKKEKRICIDIPIINQEGLERRNKENRK